MAAPTPPLNGLHRSPEVSSDEEFTNFAPYRKGERTSSPSTLTSLSLSPIPTRVFADDDVSFKHLRQLTTQINEKFNRVVQKYDSNRDRHIDIAPFLFNQVDKTNGSWVCFPENDLEVKQIHPPCPFIAICAPLPAHFADFMGMMFKYDCEILVTLTDPIEIQNGEEKVKADVYLPKIDGCEINEAYSLACLDDSTLRMLSNGWVIKKGVYTLHPTDQKKPLLFTNLHVSNWQDNTEGSEESLLALVKEIYEHAKKINNSAPIVVHCSAGIRRTGQVMGCFQIYRTWIEKQKILSDQEIFTLAMQLRLQRFSLGGDEKQFNMFFKFRDYLKKN